jgi:hypothetical protein
MPGISVSTGVRVGPSGVDTAPSSTLFIAGTADKGPIDKARLVLSMPQFESIYGKYTSATSLWDSVKTFFEEGGTRCYVARTAGPQGTGATLLKKATITVPDASVGVTLTLTAKSEGTWANASVSKLGLSAVVTVLSGAVSIEISYAGAVVFSAGPFVNETLSDGSTKYAKQSMVEAINAAPALAELLSAATGSSLLAPTAGTYYLAAGYDATATAAATNVVTALGLFDYDYGDGAVAAPGFSGATMWDGLRDHAIANRRIALCASAIGTDKATAIDNADAYWGATAADREKASYMAWYWPSVKVPDGYGSTRDQSPEAYVAAARAKAHKTTGPWRAGAGEISTARYVSGLYNEVTRADALSLDLNRINALRVIGGAVRVYGARSLSADETNWRFITYRETLNYITARAEAALEPLVFRPIDGRGNLFATTAATLTALMEPIRIGGGVYEGVNQTTGRIVDPGYSIDVSSANNPVSQLANGQVTAAVGVRVSPVADQYKLTITKSTLTATV